MDAFRAGLARGLAWLPLALLMAVYALRAQSPTGEIRLAIQDSSGAPMEASGRLRGPGGAKAARSFRTDAHGRVRLTGLPYGRYRLEVFRSGFAEQSKVLDIESPTPFSSTIVLAPASQASRVEVVATTRSPEPTCRWTRFPRRSRPPARKTSSRAALSISAT